MFLETRASGILLHISSLPGPYGIGDIGDSALHFIDYLKAAGQGYWQLLPLNPVSSVFGNSPYMSFSAFAGNPLFISPDRLVQDGLLAADDLEPLGSEYRVEYDKVTAAKKRILHLAFQSFQKRGPSEDFLSFCHRTPWLREYALFMALKEKFNQAAWYTWPQEIRLRNPQALDAAADELAASMEYYSFEQFHFFSQWWILREHAAKNGIRIIGDLPIYVGLDSVDVWANQEIFDLDPASGSPQNVAGVPPDYFSATGQRWGNPLYRWHDPEVKPRLYHWWQTRLETAFSLVDLIRIDHFRGFESYWAIPGNEKTAVNGRWLPGPGKEFFRTMELNLGPLPIIAEDLGLITPAVERLRDDLGFPGMRVLLFGFDGKPENPHLPHNHVPNAIVYTGTHDNDTVVGWYQDPATMPAAKELARRYANRDAQDQRSIHHDFIYLALSSSARLAIIPMQDILGFGNDCRMNRPGQKEGNWAWRCAPRFLDPATAEQLRQQTLLFNRLPRQNDENNEATNQ